MLLYTKTIKTKSDELII